MTFTIRRSMLVVLACLVVVAGGVFVAQRASAASATPVVYIATGENFPDALGAGPASALARGPILLVTRDSVPWATATELNRLRPDRIIVVGGTAVISSTVESQLRAWAPVTRIAGANRYETAAAVSRAAFPAPAQPPGVAVQEAYATWESPDYTNGFLFEIPIYVEVESVLVASGQVVLDSDAATPWDNGQCGLTIGTDPSLAQPGSWRYPTVSPDNPRPTCATQASWSADPGWHTVRLTLQETDLSTYAIDRSLIVTISPVDARYASTAAENPPEGPAAPMPDK